MPTPAGLVRYSVAQIEALAELPQSILTLNRSINTFAQTVGRLDALVRRIDRVLEPLETSLPPILDMVERNALPALEIIGETQAQVASIARSVDRLMGAMDDTFRRLADLPGANLMSFLRGGKPADQEREPPAGGPGWKEPGPKAATPPSEGRGLSRGREETRGWSG